MAINFPNTPSNGDTHAVGEMIFTYDAVKNSWTPLSAASGASVIVSDTPPSSPSSGDLWTDSSNMKMFIYYEDDDSSQWVEVSGSSGGGSGASGSTGGGSGVTMGTTDPLITNNGTLGELWLNTTSGELYACTDITTDDNIWTNIGDGTGNITSNVPPGNPTNTTIAGQPHETTFNHTFTGGTDTDGNVTHYIVDEITGTASGNVVGNPMTVALPEVPVGIPHQFTISTLTEQTSISFRVRSKDNSGSYSSGVTVTFVGDIVYATGGIENTYTSNGVDYNTHTFLGSDTFVVTSDDFSSKPVDILIVGGGGSGGGRHGGGGGAGGVLFIQSPLLSLGSYNITIGAGGAGVACINGNIGGNTVAFGETALGGGGGTSYAQSCNNIDGGSGGGSDGRGCATGGSSTQGEPLLIYGGTGTKYGNVGGSDSAGGHLNDGGGGAGSAGSLPNGGAGIEIPGMGPSGQTYYWAGGGGGGMYADYPNSGNGGIGGGGGGSRYGGSGGGSGGGSALNNGQSAADAGNDGANNQNAGDGGDNTGSGGGGAGQNCWLSTTGFSGSGGSGIVIVRYPI